MKHLKHPKHLKHLNHLLWMLGLLFCQHFKELGGKVKDGVHRGQDQKGMLLVLGYEFFGDLLKRLYICGEQWCFLLCTLTFTFLYT